MKLMFPLTAVVFPDDPASVVHRTGIAPTAPIF